jgi:hypothetical protein
MQHIIFQPIANKMKIKSHILPVVLLAIMVLSGCKPSVPSEFIQPDDMEDILYDYHLAMILSDEHREDTILSQVYKLAVLKKYEVSEADFDTSMVYYMRHSDELEKIYKRISDRLSKEGEAQGMTASDMTTYGYTDGTVDTVNIWQGEHSIMLTRYTTNNIYSFDIKADSSFHRGDELLLAFNSLFMYQDGSRDGVAVFSVTYNNDSVAQQTVRITSSAHYAAHLRDEHRIGIKRLRGYFLLNCNNFDRNNSATTLKLLFISDIKLTRIRENEQEVARKDSIRRAQDSISRHMEIPQKQPMNGESAEPVKMQNIDVSIGSKARPMP